MSPARRGGDCPLDSSLTGAPDLAETHFSPVPASIDHVDAHTGNADKRGSSIPATEFLETYLVNQTMQWIDSVLSDPEGPKPFFICKPTGSPVACDSRDISDARFARANRHILRLPTPTKLGPEGALVSPQAIILGPIKRRNVLGYLLTDRL